MIYIQMSNEKEICFTSTYTQLFFGPGKYLANVSVFIFVCLSILIEIINHCQFYCIPFHFICSLLFHTLNFLSSKTPAPAHR